MSTETVQAGAPILVAIDGPAGSGKSSVSREAAKRMNFGILDTGAAYRALAFAAQASHVDLDSEHALLQLLHDWKYNITLQGVQRVTVVLPGETQSRDVTDDIRTPELSAKVSKVSRHQNVRVHLNNMFRQLVADSGLAGVVVEGRDITTVVAPDAPVRLLLTASAEVRAARRAGELPGLSMEQVLQDVTARDAKDALVVDFFHPAPGVQFIDTTHLSFDESVQAVIAAVEATKDPQRNDPS